MTDVVDSLFRLLNNADVPWLLAGAIVVFAIIVWLVFRVRIRPIRRSLISAIRTLESTPSDPSEFAREFESARAELRKNPVLGNVWSEFTETLIYPDGDGPIRNSIEGASFFNESTLVASQINIRFYNSFANVLVGIGLLFTFFGLVAALYFAASGVTAGDVQQAQRELGNLLHAATFKFVTSIAGLGASIGFSWREKHHLHSLDRQLYRFCLLLDTRLELVTHEKLASEGVAESRKQTEQLERFNTDLAVSIAARAPNTRPR